MEEEMTRGKGNGETRGKDIYREGKMQRIPSEKGEIKTAQYL